MGLTADGDPAVFDYSTPRKQAIDPTTGFFADNAISGWSSETDGSNVPEGGAAEQLSSLTTRNIYTFLGDVPAGGVDLIANGTPLRETEAEITNAHLGLTGANQNVNGQAINRDNLLKWARGVDVKDSNNNGDSSETRSHMGDPMHSRPVIVNYAKNQTESYTTIFVGTNEGVLHGFDSETGEELFAYMPEDLLPNIQKNFTDATSTSHPYGFDGPISIWTIDSNNNVVIDSNETAMLFIGMRRGGSNYYAFDIADRRNPVLKWVIKGGVNGDAGFGQLGQSWSTMEPTKIRLNNQERDVLIFGGGYDTGNDVDHTIGAVAKTVDTIGRGIFIVDALTGEMLYQLGHNSDNEASQQFEDMKFAFPGGIRVMDFDGNGFADTLFAGDMGGQVWRFDLDLYHASGNLVIGDGKNVMANLGGSNAGLSGNLIGNLPNSRRFFDEPDVALIREDGERFISISVGSGWRSHPLNTDVNDRIYSMRSYDIFTLPDGYGKETSPGSGVYTPITENDLTDVTNDLNPDVGDYGWRMSFNEPGEKVAGQVQTANSALVFTTYQPETNVASCSTALGSGAVWAVRVSDGRPALDLNEDGIWDVSDRSQDLTQSGLPPEASILILEGDVTTASSSSTNNSNSGSGSDSSSGGTGTGTGQSSSGGEQTTTSTEIKTAVFVAGESVFEKLFKGSLTRRESWIDAGMRSTGAEGASIDPQTAVTDPSATSADPSQAQTAETSTD